MKANQGQMQSFKKHQHIVIKGFFILLATLFLTSFAHGASAATQQPSVNTNQTIEQFLAGEISLETAASSLDGLLGFSYAETSELLGNLANIENLNTAAALELVNGLAGGVINISGLEEINETLQNLAKGNIDPEIINGMLSSIGMGELPPEVSNALSAFSSLETLTSIESLEQVFTDPEIVKSLENLLGEGVLPEEVTKIIGEITGLISDIQAAPEEIAKAIVDALSKELVEALGGEEALTEALTAILGGTLTIGSTSEPAESSCGASCSTCKDCAPKINKNHVAIRAHVTSEFEQHRNWLVSSFFVDNIAPAMALMSSQLITTGMQQVQAIGGFFDAKHQLETQRLFQTLTAEAHKDYHPSVGLCEFGTNIRSLTVSEKRSDLSHSAIASRLMTRQLLNGDGVSSGTSSVDRASRLQMFINKFCNKNDQDGALSDLCKDSGKYPNQINMDIDYTNTLDSKLTLHLNFNNDDDSAPSVDEENLFALSSNLFANEVLPAISDELLVDADGNPTSKVNNLVALRSIAAKRSVAENSFAAIAALKTEGDTQSAPFLKAILKEAGVDPTDIEARLGEKPSYYAQMEVLTKDIYQNPNFYSNLYDKPANIERKSTALLSLELMQDRDIYDSLIRSEAILATLVEVMIQKEHERVTNDLNGIGRAKTKVNEAGGGS